MPLNQTAKYALRAMSILANLPAGDALTAKGLSDLTGIPVHYLSKIMRRLVIRKLVKAQRGHGGGFSLGRPAREISFAAILDAADVEAASDVCAFGWGQCDPTNKCPLHNTYSKLQEAVHEWMDETYLSQVDLDPRMDDVR